jgi:predicted metal-dependent hydrolase
LAEAIRIGDPAIEIRLRRNARARRMVLRVAQGGPLPTLTLPPGVRLAQARAFLSDHEGWLRRHLAARPCGAPLEEGAMLPFGDRVLTIRGAADGRVRREGDTLRVPDPPARHGPRIGAWLREEARRACVAAVERHATRLGVRHGRISLRDPRSRWGSCTATGDLMFSWRLILAPSAVLDYVVAHEVAHLVELNHSPRFWAVVKLICPDYAGPREWLRRNGAALHAHDFGSGPA